MGDHLMQAEDFSPVMIMNRDSVSPFVFCCDHAGAEIPVALGDLGVSQENRDDHIAIDVGIFATTSWIVGSLNAPLVAQPISRLVIDCNRKANNAASIRGQYDGRDVPGNVDISAEDRALRVSEILEPYQSALGDVLAKAKSPDGTTPVLIAMHSFARVYAKQSRDVDIGVIYAGDQVFAHHLLDELKRGSGLNIRYNEPYEIDFDGDYTLPVHTQRGTKPYVEIEVCQDLIATCAGQRRIARILRTAILRADATCKAAAICETG